MLENVSEIEESKGSQDNSVSGGSKSTPMGKSLIKPTSNQEIANLMKSPDSSSQSKSEYFHQSLVYKSDESSIFSPKMPSDDSEEVKWYLDDTPRV